MEKINFLYFRQVTDMANDGGLIPGVGTIAAGDTSEPGSILIPASSFRYMNRTQLAIPLLRYILTLFVMKVNLDLNTIKLH